MTSKIARVPSFALWVWLATLALMGSLLPSCTHTHGHPAKTASELPKWRAASGASNANENSDALGQWLLAELVEPGGTSKGAAEARSRLGDGARPGVPANFARAVYDESHGFPGKAAGFYVMALKEAARWNEPRAPLVAWYSARNLTRLRDDVPDLFDRNREVLEQILAQPGTLGWRAVAELEDWRASELYARGNTSKQGGDTEVVRRLGCATGIELAGPFGSGVPGDRRRSYPAEAPGPWPISWKGHPLRGTPPRKLSVEQTRCIVASKERSSEGIFYAQTFVTTSTERSVILSAQGAVGILVDDVPVFERDLRTWGIWQRFGVALRLPPGRHRILVKLLSDVTAIRIANLDGSPAPVKTDGDDSKGYSLAKPTVLADPNPLEPMVRAQKSNLALDGFLAASLAHGENMDDVASVLLAPWVQPENAAGLALEMAAHASRGDPAFSDEVRHRLEKELRSRAVRADGGLWFSRVWLVLDEGDQRGIIESIDPLRKLTETFPQCPEIQEQLALTFAKVGWRAERLFALKELVRRFPSRVSAWQAYLDALETDGDATTADEVRRTILTLDPDAEVRLDQALLRQDWNAAVQELERLEKRHPDRKDLSARIADVLARSGDPNAVVAQLGRVLAQSPDDSAARFRLADRKFASGDHQALRKALAEALEKGARATDLREALDVVESRTHFDPYRIDSPKVIREFEAWESQGHRMEGIAARVLDYAVLWVQPDGSSEMLEHEILRIQSQEAISKEAEQRPPEGLVLRLRVLKKGGAVAEPEFISGKPSLTMPHLEVGDYIEIEHIVGIAGDGQKGKHYRSPLWFFREPDKGYWRSEFLTILPRERPVTLETRGAVPPPTTTEMGTFVVRRFRVDESPPAPQEPDGPRPNEYLPSVRLGWGISLENALDRAVEAFENETPFDPRIKERAFEIVGSVPESQKDERARRLYRWVLENVEDGKELDPRRIITGKSGAKDAAFVHLARQLGIDAQWAIVRSRLALPAIGPMTEVENWDSLLVRLDTEKGSRWVSLKDKFAPYGYVPAELRGQPAFLLVQGAKKDRVDDRGGQDGVSFEARADIREDGSARLKVVERFRGRAGISLRGVFDKLPERQRRDFVESRLLARQVPGARLLDLRVEKLKSLDEPLELHLEMDVPSLVRFQGKRGIVRSVFPMRLGQAATLAERQTPLVLDASTHMDMKCVLVFPESFRLPAHLPPVEQRRGDVVILLRDAVEGHALRLERSVDIPAGRIQPGKDYTEFFQFIRGADELLEREIVVER